MLGFKAFKVYFTNSWRQRTKTVVSRLIWSQKNINLQIKHGGFSAAPFKSEFGPRPSAETEPEYQAQLQQGLEESG